MFIVSCPYSVLLPFGFEGGSKTLQDHETSEHASGDECMSTMKRLANHPVVKSIKNQGNVHAQRDAILCTPGERVF